MRFRLALLALALALPLGAQPLSLSEVQKLALEHSHAVKRQHSKAREAGYRVDEVYSGVNPHLNFKAGTSYLTPTVSFAAPNGSLSITESGNYSVGLHLEQVIHTFGRLKWSASAADLARQATRLELERERQDTLSAVTQAYVDLVFGQKAVDVAELQVITRNSHFEQARLKVQAGTIPPFEVLSFETALVQADEHLRLAQLRYKVGVSANLELLQAETSQAEASLAVHQTHHSVLRNYYLWKRATGLGLGLE